MIILLEFLLVLSLIPILRQVMQQTSSDEMALRRESCHYLHPYSRLLLYIYRQSGPDSERVYLKSSQPENKGRTAPSCSSN
jgi:hypothetical protein